MNNYNNNSTNIQVLLAIPKRERRWKYYVNGNLQDSHTTNREKLEQFIIPLVNTEAGNTIIRFLDKYFSFIVDIEQNKVLRIQADTEKAKERMRQEFENQNFNTKKILRKLKQEENKDKHDIYANQNNNLLKKVLK